MSLELTLTTRSPVIARPTVAPTPVTPGRDRSELPISVARWVIAGADTSGAPCSFTTTFRSWKVGVRAVLRNGRIATAITPQAAATSKAGRRLRENPCRPLR